MNTNIGGNTDTNTNTNSNIEAKVEVNTNTNNGSINNGGRSLKANDKKHKRDGVVVDKLVAIPVSLGASGEGLPYAPENWPLIGDNWSWKVGNRVTEDGYYRDRCLYPPLRYQKSDFLKGKGFLRSRVLVEKFVLKEIHTTNLDTFFASFLWKVPSHKVTSYKDTNKDHHNKILLECKVENKTCVPRVQARLNSLRVMDCDICCSEHGFCRDCCCILCGRTSDSGYDAYSLIRCEVIVDRNRNLICGHIAHLDCAIRAYLAGTIVGGGNDLDVEYYCRRCDNKSDLISHLTSLLHICASPPLPSQVDVEKILNLVLRALSGSEKFRAKDLHAHIESILTKLRNGIHLEEVWKCKDDITMFTTG